MLEALQYCERLAREADKDRFLATLFAPAAQRGALYALYAFDIEITQIRDRISTALPGEVRLQWWRDVLTATAPGDAGANPVAEALRDTAARYALPVPMLLDLLDARTFDLYDDPMATVAEFERYAQATSATVIGLAAQVLNIGAAPKLDDAIRHAGIASAVTAVLVNLPLHSARGQCYLPSDVLARHGVEPAELYTGRATAALGAALAELRTIAHRHLDALRAVAKDIPERLLPAFLPLALAPSVLRRMDRNGADPFRPTLLPQWRRQWTLWRAARRPANFLG